MSGTTLLGSNRGSSNVSPQVRSHTCGREVSVELAKILILSNVLDPTITLEELFAAFRTVDAVESEESWLVPPEASDARDAFVRSLTLLL
jgi:hypothetical protein